MLLTPFGGTHCGKYGYSYVRTYGHIGGQTTKVRQINKHFQISIKNVKMVTFQ